jgi:hypothetical protein
VCYFFRSDDFFFLNPKGRCSRQPMKGGTSRQVSFNSKLLCMRNTSGPQALCSRGISAADPSLSSSSPPCVLVSLKLSRGRFHSFEKPPRLDVYLRGWGCFRCNMYLGVKRQHLTWLWLLRSSSEFRGNLSLSERRGHFICLELP